MHNTLSTTPDILPARSFRPESRTMGRIQAQAQVGMARIGQEAAQQVTRVEAVACVGRRAMFEAALLTQAEQSLALLVPLASGRLQAIADVATLGIAEIVSDTVRLVTR